MFICGVVKPLAPPSDPLEVQLRGSLASCLCYQRDQPKHHQSQEVDFFFFFENLSLNFNVLIFWEKTR